MSKDSSLSVKDAVDKSHVPRLPDKELIGIILQKINLFDKDKILSDETYRSYATPKIVGEVLKAVNYSLEGEEILLKLNKLVAERRIRNAKE
jgi:hypothetical protein